ncbi:cytochrome P450 [Rhypophila decipiens]|uniref:Cytochrome P450 n=1 Tax=Rhypophila decipiens TaxID=261697 RepID=A0AAN7B5W8_9PEZI|nr:cytochrome P450 [Rhypophila decipiens]
MEVPRTWSKFCGRFQKIYSTNSRRNTWRPSLPVLFIAATVLYIVVGGIRRRGTHIWQIEKMHKEYGPIIRLNPYEIHILDPDFFDELYSGPPAASRSGPVTKLDKYHSWLNTAGAGGSTFSAVTHKHHRLRRSPLAPFFSARSVANLEPIIKSKVEKLCSRFSQLAQTGEVVRLDAAFMALTMDVICDYAFDDARWYLDKHDFEANWKDSVVKAAEGGAMARQFPWMLPLLMERVPLHLVSWMNPAAGTLVGWRETVFKVERRTIFHILRDYDLPREENTVKRLCDEAGVITGAGSETTAQTLTRIMFYLKWVDKSVLERVRAELDTVLGEKGELFTWTGLRLSYGITVQNPRTAREDIRYKDYVIPAGSAYFILMHPDIFPEPTEFRPERWLQPGKRLDKYLVSFGKGTRQCLGINLAMAELHLALAAVVSRFDLGMYETGLGDVVCKHDFFIPVAGLNSKSVRARIIGSRH